MRSGIDILVGTPGRIKDHLQNGKLDLTKVKHVVLDEVDQMLDMGFAEQVEDILRVAYKKGNLNIETNNISNNLVGKNSGIRWFCLEMTEC